MAEDKKKEDKKQDTEDAFKLEDIDVISGTRQIITFNGKALSELQALVLILNKIDKLEKKI